MKERKLIRQIIIIVITVISISILLGLLVAKSIGNLSADSVLQYIGIIISGIITMIGIMLSFAETRKLYDNEYSARIHIGKNNMIYYGNFFKYFLCGGVNVKDKVVPIPLYLENIGKSDVEIEEIKVKKEDKESQYRFLDGSFRCTLRVKQLKKIPIYVDCNEDEDNIFILEVKYSDINKRKQYIESYEIYFSYYMENIDSKNSLINNEEYDTWLNYHINISNK